MRNPQFTFETLCSLIDTGSTDNVDLILRKINTHQTVVLALEETLRQYMVFADETCRDVETEDHVVAARSALKAASGV